MNVQGMGHKPTPAMAGTVTSVKGSTITIKDLMGFTRTIHTSSSTTYTRGGQPANSSAVTNGANIAAQGAVDKNGTDLDANKVAVRLPSVAGTVQSVTGSSFVLQGRDGATHKVTTTGSTAFRQGRNQASLSDVKQGDRVVAMGDRQSNGDLTASAVQILPARMQRPPGAPSQGGAGGAGGTGGAGEQPAEPGQPGSTT
jgi:Cu/Ag efflux protein CusF